MALLILRGIGFAYPGADTWIFRSFDISIEKGEAVRLLGRNGSGKSTLLKIMSGVLDPTEGELLIEPCARVAYMDQFSGDMLAPDLTIGEQLKAVGVPNGNIGGIIEILCEFGLNLHTRLGSFIGHLSGGQRQIVALLCTLASGATVLCLDEFTSALDEQSVRVAEGALSRLSAEEGLTLILVSHSGTSLRVDRELDISVAKR